MSQTFGSFNLRSRSTSTSASTNAATSDFADAVAMPQQPLLNARSSNMQQSQILMLQILMLLHFRLSQHQHLLFHLTCFECARKLTKSALRT